jgi:broad specificity phosphatase PhoE
MKIYLIRHAEWFEKQVKLRFFGLYPKKLTGGITEFGKKQAHLLARWLSDKKISALYTSPLLRNQQTTTIIAQELKTKPLIEPNLQEIKKSSSEKEWSFWPYYTKHRYEDLNYKIEDGESVNMLIKRAEKTMKKIVSEQKGKNVAIITHAEFIKCFLSAIGFKKYLTEKETVPPASVVLLRHQNKKFYLLLPPSTRHLWRIYPESFLRKLFFKLFTLEIIY